MEMSLSAQGRRSISHHVTLYIFLPLALAGEDPFMSTNWKDFLNTKQKPIKKANRQTEEEKLS
jgi:hypothetical protein